MFHLNGFRLRRWTAAGRSALGPRGRMGRAGGLRCSGGELKAVLCQPVVYRGLITQTPIEKLLGGN